jgi:hypothetical protein
MLEFVAFIHPDPTFALIEQFVYGDTVAPDCPEIAAIRQFPAVGLTATFTNAPGTAPFHAFTTTGGVPPDGFAPVIAINGAESKANCA